MIRGMIRHCALVSVAVATALSSSVGYAQAAAMVTTVVEFRSGNSGGTHVRFADALVGPAACPLPSFGFFTYEGKPAAMTNNFRAIAVSALLTGRQVRVVYDENNCSSVDPNVWKLLQVNLL